MSFLAAALAQIMEPRSTGDTQAHVAAHEPIAAYRTDAGRQQVEQVAEPGA